MSDTTIRSRAILGVLAGLFRYPSEGFIEDAVRRVEAVAKAAPAAAESLNAFAAEIRGRSAEEMEELYTRTFDLSPACALEVGWHLYGEKFERGSFLVMMRDVMRRYGVEENVELPDHLTNVLAALELMPDVDAARLMAQSAVAVKKMTAGFSTSGEINPYRNLLLAVGQVLAEVGDATAAAASARQAESECPVASARQVGAQTEEVPRNV